METITTTTESLDILEQAKKAAYVALRTMSQKSGSPTMQKMELSVTHYPDCDADAQDVVNQAALMLLEYADTDNAWLEAVKGVHRYVYGQQRRKADQKKLYIDDPTTGEIESVNNDIHKLINCIYTDDIVNTLSAALSPTQRKVLQYMAYGYTNVTIAKRLNVSKQTVQKHIERIHDKARTLFPDGVMFD